MVQAHSLRRHLPVLLAWTVLCALFFLTILVGSEHLITGDFSGQFHAFGLFQAREMAQGLLPAWSPGSYAGVPFAADTQAAVYYLPRWLTIGLSLPWGFTYYALELEALLHIWLAGVFVYALGYAITGERPAALLAAVAFGLGGYLTSYPLLQLAILETIAWLPLALLFLRIGVSRSNPVPWLVAAGLTLALSALAGHPQTFVHVSYAAAAYYFYLALRARWTWRWVLGLGLLVGAVTIGAWSAALWPTLQYLPHTARADVDYRFVSSGLPLIDYLQILLPGVLSFWSPEYWGLAAVAAAVLALLGRRRAGQAEVGFWGVVALLSAWLALGDRGILFELVYRVAPGFQFFQCQERLMGVFSLSCALLAAQGMAAWLQMTGPERHALWRRMAGLLCGGLLLAGLTLALASQAAEPQWPATWLRQALVLALVLALLWGERWRQQRAWLLVVVLGLDLYVSTLGAVGRQPGSPAAFWPQPQWMEAVRSEEPVRLDSGGLFFGNLGEIYGLEDIRGISPLKPKALKAMEGLPKARLWQLLNVRYVLASEAPEGLALTKVAEISEGLDPDRPLNAGLYRFEGALPRAWMVSEALWVGDEAAALDLLKDPDFDPATQVVLQGDAGEPQPPDVAAAAGQPRVHVSRLGTAALRIEVEAGAPGYLVISEWHYPGWQAELEGRRVPVYRANYALQAVRVPQGKHTVVVRYTPSLETAGIVASLLALVAAGLFAWRWRPVITRRALVAAEPSMAPEPSPRSAWGRGSGLVVVLTLLGFGLRMLTLGSQELRGDEAFSFLLARLPLSEILPALLRQGDPHSPLHYWLLHGWMRLAGSSELSMRYASLIPSVLLLPLLFILGRRLGGSRLGVLVAGLAAVSQSQVWIGQDVRNQYTLVMLFSTLATLLLFRAVERPAWHRWALYGFVSTLALYSHYYGAFALLAHGLCMLAVPGWRQRLFRWGASIALCALAFLPWLLATVPRLAAAGQLSAPSHPDLASHLTAVGMELAVGTAIGSQAGRWLSLGALGLCLLGARQLWRHAQPWALMLTTWLAAAALGIFLLRFHRSTFNAFYILVASVPWWALVSVGIEWLWRQRRRLPRVLGAAALVGLVGSNALSLWNYYSDPAYSRSSGYRGVAAQVAAQAEPRDVFLRNYPDPCYDYYLRDIAIERLMQLATSSASKEETQAALSQLAGQYDRLWFVSAKGTEWDRQGVVSEWLEYNALLEQEQKYDDLCLQAYRPRHAAGLTMAPLSRSIAGLLLLEGAHVTVDGVPVDLKSPVTVPVGATIKVTLQWQTLVQPEEDYTVFVHLMSEDGRLLGQHDGPPVFGTRPAHTWVAGERLLDRHDFAVPADVAAGRGLLLVGVYQSESVVRQVWDDGQDAVRLADVRYCDPSSCPAPVRPGSAN